ncbi:MAG: site-2 protease family protein [Hyphomicrobium sp.]
MGQTEIGKIFGIPIILDASFILLAVLFGFHHFTSANAASISYGVVLVAGVGLSILLHELGHALAARYWRVPTAYIELNGLGGLCHFARPMPQNRIANIVMLLAGPLANLILWQLFSKTGTWMLNSGGESFDGASRTAFLLMQLGSVNAMLFFFNLLPSHPLDGGRTLVQIISKSIGYDRAMRFVAYLGLLIAAWLFLLAFSGQFFAALVGFVLLQTNLEVLRTHGGPRWQRWN